MLRKKLKVVAVFGTLLTAGFLFLQSNFKGEVKSLDLAFGAIAQSSDENLELYICILILELKSTFCIKKIQCWKCYF